MFRLDAVQQSDDVHGLCRRQMQNALSGQIVGDFSGSPGAGGAAQRRGGHKTVPLLFDIIQTGGDIFLFKSHVADVFGELPQPFREKIAVDDAGRGVHIVSVGFIGRNQKNVPRDQRNVYAAEAVDAGSAGDQSKFIVMMHVPNDFGTAVVIFKIYIDGCHV